MPNVRRLLLPLLIASSAFLLSMEAEAGRSWKPWKTKKEIHWISDIDDALAGSRKSGKPIMVDFMATWCPPCRAMEDSTFSDASVVGKAASFVTVRIDIEKQRNVAERYGALARKYGGIGIPNILFMNGEGRKLKHIVGYYGPRELIAAMDSALAIAN
jgi:thiol:disulfide interchange protein